MSSPSVAALDCVLILFGIAPLNLLIRWYFGRRNKKRGKSIQQCIAKELGKK